MDENNPGHSKTSLWYDNDYGRYSGLRMTLLSHISCFSVSLLIAGCFMERLGPPLLGFRGPEIGKNESVPESFLINFWAQGYSILDDFLS